MQATLSVHTPSSLGDLRSWHYSLDQSTSTDDEIGSSTILQDKPLWPPILRIPPELLTDIITLCCQPPFDRRALIIITHISRHFRDIAINFPLLWTTIDLCAHRDWNVECLRRSKEAPLDIIAWPDHMWCAGLAANRVVDRSYDLLKGEGWRVKSINMGQIGAPFRQSTIQLEALIAQDQGVGMKPGADIGPMAALALRRLTLKNCNIPWTRVRANLTHLSIVQNLSYTTPQEVLTVLANMPELEHLQLESISFANAKLFMPSVDVHLLNIKSITLGSTDYCHLRVLVLHIHYPPTADFTFSATYPPQVDAPSKLFHDIPLASHFRIKRLSLSHRVDFERSSSIKIQSTGGDDPNLIVKLVAYCNWDIYETLKTAIEDALTLPIRDIEELEVRGEGNINVSSSEFIEFLCHCGSLQRLTIGPGLVDLFNQVLEDELPGCTITSPFGTETLTGRHGTNFERNNETPSHDDKKLVDSRNSCSRFMNSCLANLQHLQVTGCGSPWSKFEKYAEKYLAFREQIGNRLKTLEISTPYDATPSIIEKWSAMAESVMWTRWEGLSYDDIEYNSEDLWWNDDLWPCSDEDLNDADD